MRSLQGKALFRGFAIVLLMSWCTLGRQTQTSTPGTAAGTAIGNGFKAFMSAAFPAGSTLINLLQSWLTKKLDSKQQTEVKTAADTKQKTGLNDPETKKIIQEMQIASDTLKLTSLVLYRTNAVTANISSMLAILDQTPQSDKLPFPRLNQKWNDAKGDLSALKEDSTLSKARATLTDTAVLESLQGLDEVTRGPVQTVSENMKPDGDRTIVHEELLKIMNASVKFNNLGIVLLGSTGAEITRSINDVTKAGGSSDLDQLLDTTLRQANDALPRPSKKGT